MVATSSTRVLELPTAANLIHSKPRGRRYLYTTPGSVRYRPPCRNEPVAQVARPCLQPPISAVISGGHCNASASLSDGVIPPRVCRGRVFSEQAVSSRSCWGELGHVGAFGEIRVPVGEPSTGSSVVGSQPRARVLLQRPPHCSRHGRASPRMSRATCP